MAKNKSPFRGRKKFGNVFEEGIEKIRDILSNKIGIVTTAQHLHMIDKPE